MRVAFIVPYFGKFPEYFELFLNSCSYNEEFEWLIISDIESECFFPKNVHYIYMTFEEIKALFQSKFTFSISLNSAYKLCDFRPAYGYLFQDYLKEYDYWGYCDIDLLFGKLSDFIKIEDMILYDKIGHLGHMTLYRNDEEINTLFMEEIDGRKRYKEVFTTNQSCIFDEWDYISVNHIFREKGKKVLYFDHFLDIFPYDENFKRVERVIPDGKNSVGENIVEKKFCLATWEHGIAFQWKAKNRMWVKEEMAYLHFQKRKMEMDVSEKDKLILCMPNRFVELKTSSIPEEIIKDCQFKQFFNVKKYRRYIQMATYWIIEKTGPVRHYIRSLRNNKKIDK